LACLQRSGRSDGGMIPKNCRLLGQDHPQNQYPN
jgi:hypothetical protein